MTRPTAGRRPRDGPARIACTCRALQKVPQKACMPQNPRGPLDPGDPVAYKPSEAPSGGRDRYTLCAQGRRGATAPRWGASICGGRACTTTGSTEGPRGSMGIWNHAVGFKDTLQYSRGPPALGARTKGNLRGIVQLCRASGNSDWAPEGVRGHRGGPGFQEGGTRGGALGAPGILGSIHWVLSHRVRTLLGQA